MNLPFTSGEFFQVFSAYNISVFPAQFIFFLPVILCLYIIGKKLSRYYLSVPLFLCILWFWMGYVYHIRFFSPINPVARVFGVMFILQSLLFFHYGIVKKRFTFNNPDNPAIYTSIFLLISALILYPLITMATGHTYPSIPTFGLPCPTTIFTIAVLMVADKGKLPKHLLVVPFLWTIIGTSAAIMLGVYADVMLIISTLLYFGLYVLDKRTPSGRIILR